MVFLKKNDILPKYTLLHHMKGIGKSSTMTEPTVALQNYFKNNTQCPKAAIFKAFKHS